MLDHRSACVVHFGMLRSVLFATSVDMLRRKVSCMSLASSIALIAALAPVLGSFPVIVFAFTYAPSFKRRASKVDRRRVSARSSMLNHR